MTGKSDLRWGIERRLKLTPFRVFWEGHVNRGDLMDAFGVLPEDRALNREAVTGRDNHALGVHD